MANGAPADERLGDSAHLDGAGHTRGHADLLEGVLEREGIDDGGEHAHVVRRRTVHTLRAGSETAEQVAAADHDGGLHPELLNSADFPGDLRGDGRIDPECLFAHERLTREFEEHAAVDGIRHVCLDYIGEKVQTFL